MSSMTYKHKKCKTDHHVIGMADSMPQKNSRIEFAFLFDHFCACKFANYHHASFTVYLFTMLHFVCSLFYPIPSSYLIIFVHFYVGFTLFIVLLYLIISQRFLFYNSTILK